MKNKKIVFGTIVFLIALIGICNMSNVSAYETESPDEPPQSLDGPVAVEWYRTWGGSGYDEGRSVATDSSGNIYIVGTTWSYDVGGGDIALIKYDREGRERWERIWGGPDIERGYGVATDNYNNIYVAGYTKSYGGGGENMLLLKYDSTGILQWYRTWDRSDYDRAYGVAVDSSGYIYLGGDSLSDMVLVKYSNIGTKQWEKTWDSGGLDMCMDIAIDSSDYIYTTGNYLMKFNYFGTIQWYSYLGGGLYYGVAVDSSDNVYTTGRCVEYSGRIYIGTKKYNSSGVHQWNDFYYGSENICGVDIAVDSYDDVYIVAQTQDYNLLKYGYGGFQLISSWGGSNDFPWGISIDSSNNIYLSGYTYSLGGGGQYCLVKYIYYPQSFILSSDASSPDNDGLFNLSWEASYGADSYSVYTHDRFITKLNSSVTKLAGGITGLTYPISGLSSGKYYYMIVAYNDVGNRKSNCILIEVKLPPIIHFDISQQYLNTTTPLETDLGLEINCTITNSSTIRWVYLCENSTGKFTNRSMSLGNNNEWSYPVYISGLERGDKLMFSFYAKDSYNNIGKNDNNFNNFTILIGDFYLPASYLDFQVCDNPNYVKNSTLYAIYANDGDHGSGVFNISYRIDSGIWILYTNPFNLMGYSHGAHTICYYATDNDGNIEYINQEIVCLDIQDPNIIFEISEFYLNTTTPQYYQTGLQINCTVQDDTSLIWVYLCENSTSIFVNRSMLYKNGNYTFNLDISSLNWGNKIIFSFYAKDSAGNIKWDNNGGVNYSIQIYDFQDPITTLDFQIVESPNHVKNSTLFILSADDDILNGGSGIFNISYRIDSEDWILYTNPFNLAGYFHGIHTIYYYAIDNAGNTEVINQEIIFLDVLNWIQEPSDQIIEYGEPYSYDLNATNLAGISRYWINDTTYFVINDTNGVITNITSLDVGIYWLEVRAYDPFDNYCSGIIRVTVEDTTNPIWISLPIDQVIEYGEDLSYNINAYDLSGIDHYWINDTTDFTIDNDGIITNIGVLTVGNYIIEVRAYDPFDNYCSGIIRVTVEDTTNPIWVQEPTDQNVEYGNGLSYDLNATDLSGISEWILNDTTYFNIDTNGLIYNITFLSIGIYWLEVRVYDSYGHYVSAFITITVQDTTNPIWISLPTDQIVEYGDSFFYVISASDLSGISYYWINDTINFNIDGNGILISNTTLPVGIYWLGIRAYDPYGLYCNVVIKITVQDTTPPNWNQISIDQTLEFGEDLNYYLNASDLSGISQYWISNKAYFNIDEYGVIANRISLTVGIYQLEVRAYDPYGNYVSAFITITVQDTTNPIWISLPTDQIVEYGDSFFYVISASDISGIDHYLINDITNFNIDSNGVLTNTITLTAGTYWLEVRAYDPYNNYCTANIRIIVQEPEPSPDDIPKTGDNLFGLIISIVSIIGVAIVLGIVGYIIYRRKK